ncbi:hypothetical protein [Mycobacteroides chelonae]|jgi:hypothetical protein|uniref:hypothetical protein n=1 Tax=Mycobacteroides chelonae TaxID=1774 RepID=UPI0008A8F3EB|nr:hypothetical protein [Mycobacteroides chelonae]MBF9326001.1 hypothetical protein [Mycobacteroides chelonae]MBF9420177.1 hypothetical protein [Mycobacteroides chelonae]MBF9438645.1 hypothetical protein [Mycobacteroides chelonae]MBV6359954.1 hypothetical protein [Mycobacteroides chelonae]MEC4834443.1 hypothetical protein [Mycobacteroides chelonae]
MTAPPDPVQAQLGDRVYLGTRLANVHFYGDVSDIDTPGATTATMEMVGDDAVVTMDALVGPKGNDGEMAPIVKMQYGSSIDSLQELEEIAETLTDTPDDIGKAWWIGNQVYMWDGTGFKVKAMGTAGPAGPVPNISPTIESIPWSEQLRGRKSKITVSGTANNPGWHFEIAAPQGPKGDNATIADAIDFDDTLPPTGGQVVTWDSQIGKFILRDPNPFATRMYTMPEAAFQSVPLAVGTKVPIGSREIPEQTQDYNLWIQGHLRTNGVDLDFDPFQIGCEVRISEPNTDPKGGILVARGFGNSSQMLHISPHASTPQTPSDAISPDGVYGRFPQGQKRILTVFLYTDGLFGIYNFQPRDAQLAIQVIPV